MSSSMSSKISSPSEAANRKETDLEKQPSSDDDGPAEYPTSGEELHSALTKEDDHAGGNLATITQSWVEHPKNPYHEFGFVSVICMAQFMTQAGLAQVIVPLHIIGDSFGTQDPGQLSWFPAAYALTVGTFILPAGRLGDLYGHKKMVMAGFVWWSLWSVIAGLSIYSGPILLDVCRAMQGIGPAFCLPNAVAILGRTYRQGVRKQMMFSAFGATAPTGFVVGAIFTSLLAKYANWQWAFYINAITTLLLAILSFFLIPTTPPPHLSPSESTWVLTDALGGVTGVSGLVLVNIAWNQAPIVGWSTPYTYVLLIVGLVVLGGFGYVEVRVSKFPLVPFKDMAADSAFILACIALGWSGFSVWTYYFWQFLLELRQISPLLASVQFIPVCFSGLAAAVTTGYIIHRVPGSLLMGISLLAFSLGLILLATAPVDQTYWAQTFVSVVIMPWGMDMSFPAANLLLSNKMPRESQGVSASLVNTVINYSISLALGFAGTIEGQVNDGGKELLMGYRGAWYLGIGMGIAGICCAGVFAFCEWREKKRK